MLRTTASRWRLPSRDSVGTWRALGTLHHRGRSQRAGEPPPPPNSHPEAFVLSTTCHSLAVWTPVDSVYLKGGREGDGGTVRRVGEEGQASIPPQPLAHEGRPYLIRVAWQVCGQFLGLHIPHLQCAVTAATDQEPAVGRPRNLVHGSHMATQGGQVPGPGEGR